MKMKAFTYEIRFSFRSKKCDMFFFLTPLSPRSPDYGCGFVNTVLSALLSQLTTSCGCSVQLGV